MYKTILLSTVLLLTTAVFGQITVDVSKRNKKWSRSNNF
jgi:hypothetical protein